MQFRLNRMVDGINVIVKASFNNEGSLTVECGEDVKRGISVSRIKDIVDDMVRSHVAKQVLIIKIRKELEAIGFEEDDL